MPERRGPIVYPYIPNSEPQVKLELLRETGSRGINQLLDGIPEELRYRRKLDLPRPLLSESALRRRVEEILERNKTCREYVSFLGAGCWQHYVPAVCDEVNQRGEFLTAYAGQPYEDHGRFQALFEYTSMMGELLDMDVVNIPTYDWFQAAATSIRMASRLTGRHEALVSQSVSRDKLSKIRSYCGPDIEVRQVDHDPRTGQLALDSLEAAISRRTAAVYFENPSYLGPIETQGREISEMAHAHGAISIVGVDPISLGVLVPPSSYGADIACGDIQPLGIHMQFGGGQAGFIATRDEERFVREYPSRLFGITSTSVEGEYGFGDVAYDRTSLATRERGKEFVGTGAALWGITAGVYLALMGPQGMSEIGRCILLKSRYAILELAAIRGVRCPGFESAHFKEFVVDFNGTGKTVAEINRALLTYGIYGGKDLSEEVSGLGSAALYCVTEVHTEDDIEQLVNALKRIIG